MRQQLKLVALSLVALSAGRPVQAQDSLKTKRLDEVVVTGARVETPVEKSGKMIYRISAKDLERSGARTVADALYRVPGVQMDGNFGAPGTNIDYFVRGASSKRTLILIDGVPYNDPSGIDQTYDLRLLDLAQVESIEVLRGGLSSLYGTGAAAAVINIQTKKAASEELRASVGMDYGSFNTLNTYWSADGQLGNVSYLVSSGYRTSEGFSSAKDPGIGGYDADGMKSENARAQIGYQISSKLKTEIYTAYDHFENEFDALSFTDDRTSGSEYFQKRIGTKTSYTTDKTAIAASYFGNFLERRFNYGGFEDNYLGQNDQGNIQINQQWGNAMTIIGGLDYQKMAYEQPFQPLTSFEMTAPYLSWMVETGGWNVQIGGRLNSHSAFGNQLVYNVNPSYAFDFGDKTLKVLANYSTSFITPSLYQLNGPYGNGDLSPEESENADVGVGFLSGNGWEMNAVYFQRIDSRFIDFEAFYDEEFNFIGGQYYNTDGHLRVEGVEVDFRYVQDKWQVNGSYAWLNDVWGSLRLRVPRLKTSVGGSYQYVPNGNVSLNYTWTGKRNQLDPETFQTVATASFGLVDLAVNHRFGKLICFGSVNNLLDEAYDAILGYTTIGRNYTVGFRMNLTR